MKRKPYPKIFFVLFLTVLVSLCIINSADASGFFGGGGSGSNSFETIDVPAGTDPVADSAGDTLTITETTPFVFTGTAATDTIDVTVEAGADFGSDGTLDAGSVVFGSEITNLSGDVTTSGSSATTIAANAVALTTDTTGNYVASVATTSGITGGAAGSEGAILSLSFDYTATLANNPGLSASEWVPATTGLIFEGSTANTNELLLTSDDPGSDITVTIPAVTGTIITTGDTATVTATILADSSAVFGAEIANLSGDVTTSGSSATTIADNAVDGTDLSLASEVTGDVMYFNGTDWVRLAIGTAGQVLEVNAGATAPEWDTDDGTTTNWDTIGNPTGAGAIAMAETVQTLDWDSAATAAAYDALSLTFTHDSTTDTNTQRGLVIEREATAGTATFETLVQIGNNDTDGLVSNGIEILAAAGLITTALNASDAEIGTALAIGSNDLTTGATTISSAELDRLDGLAGTIVTDATAVTNIDGDGMTITAGALNVVAGTAITVGADSVGVTADGIDGASLTDAILLDAATSFGDGGTTNYTTFSTAGVITYAGSARPRRTIVLTAGGAEAATTAAASTRIDGTNVDYRVLDFDQSADEQAFWTLVIPDSFAALGDAQINWQSGTTTNDVIWAIQGLCVTNAEAMDAALSTAQTVTDTALGTANQKNEAAISSLSFAGSCAAGELLHVRIYRDADAIGDTHAADARLINVEIEYLANAESD